MGIVLPYVSGVFARCVCLCAPIRSDDNAEAIYPSSPMLFTQSPKASQQFSSHLAKMAPSTPTAVFFEEEAAAGALLVYASCYDIVRLV